MQVNQGDIYWVQLDKSDASEHYPAHPHVVIQDNVLNRSRIDTLVVCLLTSNLKQAKAPGNVLLEPGEANLSKQSVVVVSRVSTIEKGALGEYIGSLDAQRIRQILSGMQFLQSISGHR
jgi:mRNA interferase MazF